MGLPDGFRYYPNVLSLEEEEALARELAKWPAAGSVDRQLS
jgi:hypothetical protein